MEPLRIQAAAVVAQQAALTELELRLAEREAALARQEEQLAGRLEEQRRQLLDLQDQITDARIKLREKRAAHITLAERQARELADAREEAAEMQRATRAERHRLKELRRRLILRGRRHGHARRKELDDRAAAVRREAERLAAERAAFAERVQEFNGRAELDKRRLAESWDRLQRERQEFTDQRRSEETAAAALERDLARRAKAAAAAAKQVATDRARVEKALAERRRELEQLETRIVNGRTQLLQFTTADTRHEPRDTSNSSSILTSRPSRSLPSEPDIASQKRAEALARLSDDLSDQRLHLVEQAERLLRSQHEWHADRAAALQEIETIATSLQGRELDLDRRARELAAARATVQAEYEALGQLRLRLEAERARADARDADRRAEVHARWVDVDARERTLQAREDAWHTLLRTWGRRRHREVLRLRDEQEACRQERAEWVAARAVWLRLTAKLREERRALTVRAAAMEQLRAGRGGGDRAAARRLQRIERRWATQCEYAARELERLQATLAAEAARLDETARRVRKDVLAVEARAAQLDHRAAEVEREEQALVAERLQMAGQLDAAHEQQSAAERRAAECREEVERLARLLIDARPAAEVPPSQAA